jgi:hypothetical protein
MLAIVDCMAMLSGMHLADRVLPPDIARVMEVVPRWTAG